jgi:CheY-like chemotaxis protein
MKYIIVAEDDKFYANVYKVKLGNLGYDVTVVPDGDKAIEEARKRKPDIFLIDMIMPGKDGLATIKALRAMNDFRQTPIIVLSSLSQEEDRQKALEFGANDFWVKTNISISAVAAKIKEYLGE